MRKPSRQLLKIMDVINSMEKHWPLTLRQIYYQLVAELVTENHINRYKALSAMLSRARLNGIVPWEAIEDRSRTFMDSDGWDDSSHFIAQEVDDLLRGYRRDLQQGQGVRLELWIEKDALARIAHNVAYEYCVPVIVAKGFASMSFKKQCADRVLQRYRDQGDLTRILYLGDLDPSGWFMLPIMMKTLKEDMGLGYMLSSYRIALNEDQVHEFNLPTSPDAFNENDTRAEAYFKLFGDLSVELDALRPQILEDMIREGIEDNLDLSEVDRQRDMERQELGEINRQRERVMEALNA